MTRRAWTTTEQAELERLINEGLRMREIAAALNRSPDSVAAKVAREGLELLTGRGRPRKFDYHAIGAMLDDGARPADVAAVYGRSAEYAARMVRR